VSSFGNLWAQNSNYWQQHVDYKMEPLLWMYQRYTKAELVYTNNSQDTLRKVYYHLFNNAFQPGSEMDVHSNIKDPDGRMVSKIKVGDKEIKKPLSKQNLMKWALQ
jgi:hypothetical protein